MTRCTKNQVLDCSMGSIICQCFCYICILQYHIKALYLLTWICMQLITIKTDKVLSTLFRYLCCLNSKACLATIQIDNINTRIILAYIFASTKAMEGNEQLFSKSFKCLLAHTCSCIQIVNGKIVRKCPLDKNKELK